MINLKTNKKRFWKSEARWYLLGIAWVAALIISGYGFLTYSIVHQLSWNFTEIFYRSLQLIVLESGSVDGPMNLYLDIARFSLPALTGITALQAVSVFFYHQLLGFRLMLIRNHLVVVGTGPKSFSLVRDASSKGIPCLVIGDNFPAIKNFERSSGVDFIHADPNEPESLRIARIERASHLVFFLDDDTQNLRGALNAKVILGEHSVNCVIELKSLDLVEIAKGVPFSREGHLGMKLEIFNDYARASQWLIDNDPVWNEQRPPKVVEIFSVGNLGTSLMEKILYTWNAHPDSSIKKLILYDQDATIKSKWMIQRHPEITKLCNLEVREVNLQSRNEVEWAIGQNLDQKTDKIYLCNSDPLINLQLILMIQAFPQFSTTDIHVRMSEDLQGLASLLGVNPRKNGQARIFTFDLHHHFCTVDLVLGGVTESLARGLFYEYRKASLLEPEQNAWEKLKDEEKKSNRHLAGRILKQINQYGYRVLPLRSWSNIDKEFLPDELDQMARHEHCAWRDEKIATGWRHGLITDPSNKIHADLVEWENLPPSEKKKNIQFFIGLPRLLANLGYSLERNFEALERSPNPDWTITTKIDGSNDSQRG